MGFHLIELSSPAKAFTYDEFMAQLYDDITGKFHSQQQERTKLLSDLEYAYLIGILIFCQHLVCGYVYMA